MGIHTLQLVSGLRNRMEIEVSEQEPISTAPKDGSEIEVLSKEYTVPADDFYPGITHRPRWYKASRDNVNKTWSSGGAWSEQDEVTHWRSHASISEAVK